MSWDVLITIGTKSQDPLANLAAARPGLERAGSIGALFSVHLLDHDYLRDPTRIERAPEGAALDADVLARLQASAPVPAAKGFWEAARFTPLDEGRDVEPWQHRVALLALGPDYRWPALAHHRAALVLDAGDYKHYSPTIRGRAGQRNLDLLARECVGLVEGGASDLRGLDAERDPDPRSAWLVFHADPAGYTEDLRLAGLPAPELSQAEVLDVALGIEDLVPEETSRGPIFYSARGPIGTLAELYAALSRAR